MIDAQVAADADQPGLKVGAPVERVERLEDLQEHVLRQILGLVVLAGELVGDVEHLAPVLPDDLLPRVLVAGQAALNERVDGVRGCGEVGQASGGTIVPRCAAARWPRSARLTSTAPCRRGMIAGPTSCPTPRPRRPPIPPSRGCRCRTSPPPSARRATSTARRRSATRTGGSMPRFGDYPHAIHYALKANSSLAIVRLLQGAGRRRRRQLDGRSRRRAALRVHARPRSCSPASARAPTSCDRAVALGLNAINVESPGELDRLDRLAQEQRHDRPRRAARQSGHRRPQPPAHLHRAQDQQVRRADRRRAGDLPRDPAGARGSRPSACTCTSARRSPTLDPLCARRAAAVDLARALRAEGVPLRHIDFGGGLGISYDGTPAIDPRRIRPRARRSRAAQRPHGAHRAGPRAGRPGRRAADARRRRETVSPAARRFVVLDAGMTELMRPALYGAFHRIEPVRRAAGAPDDRRHRRADLREHRHLRPRPASCRRWKSAI